MKKAVVILNQKKFFAAATVFFGIMLLIERENVARSVSDSLSLCAETVIPSMFPFMALSAAAVNSGAFSGDGKAVKLLMNRVFHLPACCFTGLFFGFTGGYPVGASTVCRLYESGNISKKEAERMFSFCINSGPAFTVSAAGGMILGSEKTGAVLLLSCCISSVIIGVSGGIFCRKDRITERSVCSQYQEPSEALIAGTASAVEGILSVCGWMIVFSAFRAAAEPFFKSEFIKTAASVFLEVTTGLPNAAKAGGASLCAAAVSFGGFCVMLQLMPYMKKCGIKASRYLFFRIINSLLSFAAARILLPLTGCETVSVFNEFRCFSHNAPSSAVLLIAGGVLIADMASNYPRAPLRDF